MDDSARLRNRLETRAATRRDRRDPDAPGTNVVDLVMHYARKHGVDPANIRPATDAEMAAKEREIRRERLENQARIMLSRLPEQYRTMDLPRDNAGVLALNWLNQFVAGETRGGLVITGPVGTGKTALVAAIVRRLSIEHTVPSTLITVTELLDALRPSSNTPGLGVDMIQFQSTPVLVLDDLGAEVLSQWGEEQLYRLAHARIHNGRPIIVTTNLDGPAIRKRYSERVVERLFGGSKLITMAGKSRREMPF